MFCKQGIFVNWGNIPHIEIEFGPINLFSGGNGSGKTTAADGLQSLMTAAHENLFNFNPGQDETTQRGRGGKQVRTLASYVLGCDDGSFARLRMCDGYVAANFHPTVGESGEKFVAVMGVRARLDASSKPRQARQDELLFLIIPNTELSIDDFVVEDKSGKYVVPITEIAERIKQRNSSKGVEVYDKKGPYLRRLYAALRGQRAPLSDREAKHAARTFSNFMAYKPVKSISEFVSREVLDPKDLTEDIRQVSELMKTIHSMDEETKNIKEAVENLGAAKLAAENYINHWIDSKLYNFSDATQKLGLKQSQYLNVKNEQHSIEDKIKKTQNDIESNLDGKRVIHETLIDLQAQRQGVDALRNKDKLQNEIEEHKKNLVAQVGPLIQQDEKFASNFDAVKGITDLLKEFSIAVELPELESKTVRKAFSDILALGNCSGIDAEKILTKDWVGVSDLENQLTQVNALESKHHHLCFLLNQSEASVQSISIRDQVFKSLERHRDVVKRAEQQLKNKQAEIQKLEKSKASYPEFVEQAVLAIEKKCPQASPLVLCDFIEITDPEWQMAIEGYIGGARFSIIVEPEFEAEAIRIVRALPGRKNRARVLQGRKAQKDAEKGAVPHGSIIEIMAFTHKIAEYFIRASYGSVVKVHSETELKKTARGLMSTGLGSGNYSMFRCDMDDANLVFGQGARQRALHAKQKSLASFQQEHKNAEQQYSAISRCHELLQNIMPVHCTEQLKKMIDSNRLLQKAENQLSDISLKGHSALEKRLEEVKTEYLEAEKLGNSLSEALGALENQGQRNKNLIKKLASELEDLQKSQEDAELSVKNIAKIKVDFDSESRLEQAEMAASGESDFIAKARLALAEADKCERNLYQYIAQHNQISNSYNSIVYFTGAGERHDTNFFEEVVKIVENIAFLHNRLKNNVLIGKHEKLSSLRESFNTAFVTNLCHSIYQAINSGERTLVELNTELEHHRFGTDSERFYFAFDWVPEFYEYYQFFKEVINIPSLGDGSTLFDADISAKSASIRDKLLAMLLDKDEQSAMRELKRLSDYRHYRSYEIFKEPLGKEPIPLSTYGTGSGGQLETPAYIIRSAAITSAFRFNEGNTHCRMVLVDEAFSKMDETRSREVIHYLTQTLGLQLIFIMPTSKSGPFLDLVSHQVVFSKCPTTEAIGELHSRVLVDRKICNTEKIKDLWAQHRKTIRQQAMLDFMEDIVV